MSDLTDPLNAALTGRYKVERELGRGGMATVFLARDLRNHSRAVAIKVLDRELAAAIGPERFLREIEIAAGLSHPHIVPLYESGAASGLLFYVMPYAEGESLRQRLEREKQLPIGDAVSIAREVADALAFAHRHGVVHRDIKPENILLHGQHAVVADFGVARAALAAGGQKLTETGVQIGTPAYMSPEQVMGSGELDGRSDVYSLGCVLYEMLAGQPPFTGATVQSLTHQHLNVAPRPVTDLRPTVPAEIARTIQRSLAKTAADRFRTADEFAHAIGEVPAVTASAVEPARPASEPTPEPGPKTPPSRWLSRLALIGGLVLAVAVAVALKVFWPHPPRSTKRLVIAVLPFQNLSAEGPNSYFAGGLHEEVLTQLAKVAALKVISRTSVMPYQGSLKPLKTVASELGAGSVVEGSVQVVGDRLRVNVQLIDAATDEHLWAEHYDRTLDDAFAIQSDVAQKIADAVGVAVSSAEQGRLATPPTANAEAYRLYLQGLEYYRRPGSKREDLESAQQLFERGLALDPNFALAHAALSLVHGGINFLHYDHTETRRTRQREEAEAALRLAPDLPQAHVAMGRFYYQVRVDYPRALEEYTIALRGLPNDAELWRATGAVHRRLGHWSEMMAAYEKATQLNPRDANQYTIATGNSYWLMHRYADAAREYERAVSLAPDLLEPAIDRGWIYADWQGQLDTLRVVLDRAPIASDLTFSNVATNRAVYLLWERDTVHLLEIPGIAGGNDFSRGFYAFSSGLYAGWAYRLRGDQAAARAAFDSARVRLKIALKQSPDDWLVHAPLGLALAGLGRRAEALGEARWLQQSAVYREDHFDGPRLATVRAQILAQTGEADAALDEIARLLAEPSWLSVHELQLDPLWDPIRNQPRFKALVAKY